MPTNNDASMCCSHQFIPMQVILTRMHADQYNKEFWHILVLRWIDKEDACWQCGQLLNWPNLLVMVTRVQTNTQALNSHGQDTARDYSWNNATLCNFNSLLGSTGATALYVASRVAGIVRLQCPGINIDSSRTALFRMMRWRIWSGPTHKPLFETCWGRDKIAHVT